MKTIFKKSKKILCCGILVIIMLAVMPLSASAAFYTKTISSSESGNILDIVLANEGQTAYSKGYYLFYNSSFAAAYNKTFPYKNSAGSTSSVFDNGTTYSITSSAGCMAYSNFVCKYVFGTNSISASWKYISSSAGNMTADNVRSVITEHAQLGEQIRIDNTHSMSFIAYDANGFYYTDYATDSDPKIYIHYTTWSQFKNECNAKGKTAWIYNTNTSVNSSTSTVTISNGANENEVSNNNAIVYYYINKPSGWSVTKIGIRVRKDGYTYSNGWDHYQAPANGNYSSWTSVPVSWDFKNEVGFTPAHLTKYYYQFYAQVNGKEYWSDEFSITTTGSHTYPSSWTTTKAATCTADGSAKRSCTSCGNTETKTLSKLGHNYSSSWTVDTAATCTTDGSKSYHCSRCTSKSSITAIPATGHSYGSWKTVTSPTCSASGKQERTCTKCSTKENKTLAASGHQYSTEWTTDKAATCTVDGTRSKHCLSCSSKTSVTTIAATGHTWGEYKVTTAATTEKQGVATRSCLNSGCSASETKSIPKLASDGHTHLFGNWSTVKQPDCTQKGEEQRSCSSCGETEAHTISELGHDFGEWSDVDSNGAIKRICSGCQMTEEQIIEVIVPETSSEPDIPADSSDAAPSDVSQADTAPTENPDSDSSSNSTLLIVIIVLLTVIILMTAAFTVYKVKKTK